MVSNVKKNKKLYINLKPLISSLSWSLHYENISFRSKVIPINVLKIHVVVLPVLVLNQPVTWSNYVISKTKIMAPVCWQVGIRAEKSKMESPVSPNGENNDRRSEEVFNNVLSPIEPCVMQVQSLLVWESPRKSAVLFIFVHLIFWWETCSNVNDRT